MSQVKTNIQAPFLDVLHPLLASRLSSLLFASLHIQATKLQMVLQMESQMSCALEIYYSHQD